MSYQQFSISTAVVADLYKTSLVIIDNEQASTKTRVNTPANTIAAAPAKWHLGDNNQLISIIVEDHNNVYLDEASLEFLSKMLVACKLNLADVAIINMAKTTVDIQQIKAELKPARLIFFGVEPASLLSFSFPPYKLQGHDSCEYLSCPPLPVINGTDANAQAEKRKLWNCLKEMFKV